MTKIRVAYKDDEERDALLAQSKASGMRLVEDAIHVDGNFLTFSDEPEAPSLPDLKAQFASAITVNEKLLIIAARLGLI